MKKIFQKFSYKGLKDILGIIPVVILAAFSVFFVVRLFMGDAKVYIIDDNDYLFSMRGNSMPENIRIEDPIWGITSVSDTEIIRSFYDYISALKPADNEGNFSKSSELLYGTVYMSDGKLINFELGKGIRIDGVEYGDKRDTAELASYLSLLKNNLYNTRNLSNIIKAQSKVRIKKKSSDTEFSDEKTLATDQKDMLRKILLSAKTPAHYEKGWRSVSCKGKVISSIELYVDENSKSPEVYIVNYESGLCTVFDSYGSQSGSIMQIMADMSGLDGRSAVRTERKAHEIEGETRNNSAIRKETGAIFILGSYHEDMIKALSQEFEKKTGCKVNYVRMSTGEAQKRLLSRKSGREYDVWIGGTVDAHEKLKSQGVLEAYLSENEKNISEDYRDPNYVWKPQYMEILSIGVNKDRWNKEFAGKGIPYPDNLEDLLNPAFKGEIVIPNPAFSGTGYIFLASILDNMGEKKGRDYIKALNKQVGQYTGSGFSAAEKTGLGEYLICINFLSDQSLVNSFGYSVESSVYENAGWTLVPVSLIKSKNINPYAKKFVDFCLTKEAGEILVGLGNVIPVGNYEKDVKQNQLDNINNEGKTLNYNKKFSPWGAAYRREEIIDYFTKEILLNVKK